MTRVEVAIGADGRFQADVHADLDALAVGAGRDADSATVVAALVALEPGELEERVAGLAESFRRRSRILFDGRPADFSVAFPQRRASPRDTPTGPTLLGLVARLEGRVPAGAATLSVKLSRAFPPVHLRVRRPGGEEVRRLVEAGAESEPVALAAETPAESRPAVASSYLALGFVHIVPEGVDHMLFVLGLFLLAARFRPLLVQVTAFTAAHTVTLALSALGLVSLSPRVVEPLIALSIAAVALENVATSELRPWRPLVVFGFGLLHGLGFAGVLGGLGLPAGEKLTALLAFNAGVELGQLAVLAAAFALLGGWRDRPWYRSRVAVPLSLAIAAVGLAWAVARLAG